VHESKPLWSCLFAANLFACWECMGLMVQSITVEMVIHCLEVHGPHDAINDSGDSFQLFPHSALKLHLHLSSQVVCMGGFQ